MAAIGVGLAIGRCGDQVVDAESFVARAAHRVSSQRVQVAQAEQCVYQATVTDVDLGSLDQSFAHIAAPGLEPANQLQVDEQVDVARQCGTADPQAAGQARLLQQGTLLVGQHGP